jgi:hypothetical protein
MLLSIWRVRPGNPRSSSGTVGRKLFAGLLLADLPDHAGARDLHQRSISRVLEPGIGVGAPEITNRAIIGDIGAAIGAKPNIGRPVEPVRKSLLEGLGSPARAEKARGGPEWLPLDSPGAQAKVGFGAVIEPMRSPVSGHSPIRD